jgi:hypothetical protein
VGTVAPLRAKTKKVSLIFGGVFAVLALALEVYAGGTLAYGEMVPWPPAWWGLVIAVILGMLGPLAVLLSWKRPSRREAPFETKVISAEIIGISVGLATSVALLLVIGMLSVI